MSLNKRPYKGCRDFFPVQMRTRQYLTQKMSKVSELYGFEPYDGPLLEEVELYKAKSGEELINDQIYSFTDRGERFVAIRPEMTPTLARMIASSHKQTPKPIRWYSIPNLMRYENPQKGRLREHWQFNVDIFGAPDYRGEIEIINLMIHFLEELGANASVFSIQINDRQIVDALFNDLLKVEKKTAYKLYKVLDRSKKIKKEKLQADINELLPEEKKAQILNEYLELDSFEGLQSFLKKHNIDDTANNLTTLNTTLTRLRLNEYLQYDPSIVRGLDYYTGIVFEVFDKNPKNPRAIAGGGAYRDLLKIFNEEPLPGVGFGLGDVTLRDFLEGHNLLPNFDKPDFDLLICPLSDTVLDSTQKIAHALRKNNVKVECVLAPTKMNKVFKLAESKGHKFLAVIGEGEIEDNKIQIKNLETRESTDFDLIDPTKIADFLKGN